MCFSFASVFFCTSKENAQTDIRRQILYSPSRGELLSRVRLFTNCASTWFTHLTQRREFKSRVIICKISAFKSKDSLFNVNLSDDELPEIQIDERRTFA